MVRQPGVHMVPRPAHRVRVHDARHFRLISVPAVHFGSGRSGVLLLVQCSSLIFFRATTRVDLTNGTGVVISGTCATRLLPTVHGVMM